MDNDLAEQGLRLTYLRHPSRHAAFDPCRILGDLFDRGTASAMLPWQNGLRMGDSDHLVLATGRSDGRCVGAIAATEMATDREPFLFLDAAYLSPASRAPQLLHRMLAFTLLRIAGEAALPVTIAACVQTPCYARMLHEFGRRFANASLFPAAPDAVVIDLGMTSLARRIQRVVRPGARRIAANGPANALASPTGVHGQTLVAIDMSMAGEADILDEARRIYRARPHRIGEATPAGPQHGVTRVGRRRPVPAATQLTAIG